MSTQPIQLSDVKRARGVAAGDHWSTPRKMAWIEQLARDHELSALALRLGLILAARFVNRQTGDAWPSHERLQAEIGGSPEGLRKAVKSLETRGHIHVTHSHGRGISNRYRPLVQGDNSVRKPQHAEGFHKPETPTRGGVIAPMKTPPRGHKNPNNVAEKTPTRGGVTPLSEPLEEPFERERAKRRKPETSIPDGFPDAEAIADATARLAVEGRQDIRVDIEAQKFRDHALDKDRRSRDWRAAYRTWIGNSLIFNRRTSETRTGARAPWSAIEMAIEGLNDDRSIH